VAGEWRQATEQLATLADARQLIETLGGELDAAHRAVAALRHRLDRLCRHVFGRRSEKGVPEGQGLLARPGAAGPSAPDASDEDAPAGSEVPATPARRRTHRGRRRLPAELPRERIEIPPRPADAHCPQCAGETVRIRDEVTEGLDYQPASFVIREYVRGVYVCPGGASAPSQPPLPARPIEKGRPEPGLLAQVVTSKYGDHLPLYRLAQIFARHGVVVTRRTLAEWNGAVADLLAPVVTRGIKGELLASPWIQCDDTTIDVQVDDRQPQIRTGHLWTYRGMGGEVVYDFTWSRNGEGPERMLAAYRGYLQADAAPAYDGLFARHPDIVEVGCWAHARRYFKAAVSSAAAVAVQMRMLIRELYAIERGTADLAADARGAVREARAAPRLARIRAWLKELEPTVLPKSPLAEAIGYVIGNWDALTRYTQDGRLKIDNNGAERAIKPVVLGRKNWLFCGSEAAAHRAAILLSLVQTCKHVGVDPFVYLRDIIDRVSAHPMARIGELTPRPWRQLRQSAKASPAAACASTCLEPHVQRPVGALSRQAACQDAADAGMGFVTR
jgi:transposase